MDDQLKDIDGKMYYTKDIDPQQIFNKLEITLSHLFRKPMSVFGDRNYSDCLFQFLQQKKIIRPQIVEVGGGLGDLALNMLNSSRKYDYPIDRYIMFDISPALLEAQREKLSTQSSEYILGDCFALSEHLPEFDGMIISNAMIADLRSVFVESSQRLSEFDVQEPEWENFASGWIERKNKGQWIHIGAMQFLREIYRVLNSGSTAVILEYGASAINQPSFFKNEETEEIHTKCGIDFDQAKAYSETLGFHAEVADIEEIWGINPAQKFLTVDVFTCKEEIARSFPLTTKFWNEQRELPILAYTQESLKEALESPKMNFTPNEAEEILSSLEGCFHSIHDQQFDRLNPTTWGYKCLLLSKP